MARTVTYWISDNYIKHFNNKYEAPTDHIFNNKLTNFMVTVTNKLIIKTQAALQQPLPICMYAFNLTSITDKLIITIRLTHYSVCSGVFPQLSLAKVASAGGRSDQLQQLDSSTFFTL